MSNLPTVTQVVHGGARLNKMVMFENLLTPFTVFHNLGPKYDEYFSIHFFPSL